MMRILRVHDDAMDKVPQEGPLLLIINHVNFLDVPLVYSRLVPRKMSGYARHDSWDNPFKALLFSIWGAYPLRRGEADLDGLRWGLERLKEEWIIGIAPEGTRSGDGRLLEAHPGAAFLAQRSGAPILPIVYYGHEDYRNNFPWRRTDTYAVVGEPFMIEAEGRVTQEMRKQMLDEMMYQMAALLPPEYRGVYSDLDSATEEYLIFPEGSKSNLLRAKE